MVHHEKNRTGSHVISSPEETIAAIATPPGRGGVGIVRVSGPLAGHITQQVCNIQPAPRQAVLCDFLQADGTPIDTGLILYFPAPRSFTGEDVLELHGHGGPVVMDMLLARILELGVRLARPGEFSERAFLNSKIDLAQAEAIADLIDSASRQAARLALHSLQGVFSQKVQHLVEQMIQLRLYVEAAIDFPEEEIDFLSEGKVGEQLTAIQQALVEVISNAHQGCLLREGMTVVLAGQPNAGKSTLLNALTERDSAIVTDIPGTTRDILREQIVIDGMPLHIIDTAGLRDSADTIELEGIHRAWTEIHRADRVLLLVDDRHGITVAEQAILERLPGDGPQLSLVRNKIDLSHQVPGIEHGPLGPEIRLSAKSGEGMPLLREHLKACMGYQNAGEGGFMARRRHLDALQRAEAILTAGGKQFLAHGAGELLAEDLRQAQQALGEITGEFTSDDLLGRIFSSFCIGK